MALIHFQFESIHPFHDGNGRTGRILNVLYLILKKKLSLPVLYLSKYINSNKSLYYDCLNKAQKDLKNIVDYIIYIVNGVYETCIFTIDFIRKFNNVMEECGTLIQQKAPKIYSKELVEYLFFDFYTKNEYFRKKLSISRNTATKYLNELVDIGILSVENIGVEKLYKNNYLFELMKVW